MKKCINTMALLAATVFTLSSCSKEVLRGEGSIATETRSLQAFSGVMIAGNREAEIIKSNESKVEITGYANLVGAYASTVSNGQLRFDYPNRTNVRNDNIRLKIYTPNIADVQLSGNTSMTVGEGFVANRFVAHLSGSGNLDFKSSIINELDLHTSGNARIDAEPVTAQRAEIHVSGNGRIQVRAQQFLKVRISGNGEVHYWGNPNTDVEVSGNGKAIRH